MITVSLVLITSLMQACSNLTELSTVEIYDNACLGARSCMSMSGSSVVANSSCDGPQACKGLVNG